MLIQLCEIRNGVINPILINPEDIQVAFENLAFTSVKGKTEMYLKNGMRFFIKESPLEINTKISHIKEQKSCDCHKGFSIGKFRCRICEDMVSGTVGRSGLPLNDICRACQIRYRLFNRTVL